MQAPPLLRFCLLGRLNSLFASTIQATQGYEHLTLDQAREVTAGALGATEWAGKPVR